MAHGAGGRKLNIVVEGCCHGELPKIYASVLKMQQVISFIFVIFCCLLLQILNGSGSACGLSPRSAKRGAI